MLSPSRSRLSVLLGGRAIIVNKQIRHIMCQNSLLFLGADTRRAVLLANVGLPRGLGREALHLLVSLRSPKGQGASAHIDVEKGKGLRSPKVACLLKQPPCPTSIKGVTNPRKIYYRLRGSGEPNKLSPLPDLPAQ